MLIPGGVGPGFLEYIVVADDRYDQMQNRVAGTPLAEKVLAASQYYAKNSQGEYVNERLHRGNRVRQHIIDILHSIGSPRGLNAGPVVEKLSDHQETSSEDSPNRDTSG